MRRVDMNRANTEINSVCKVLGEIRRNTHYGNYRVITTSEKKVEFSPSFITCLDCHQQIAQLASPE